jgi:DNA-binding CsgD family transcriptional regulator/tetratricopeptide (TPR) repeat protein
VGPPDSSSQGRLFEHVLRLLGRLAGEQPLLLVIEDIHWADRSTLDLLRFLARNLRLASVVVIASYRTDELHRSHPLLPFLAEQERRGTTERIELGRFDRSEIAALTAGIMGSGSSSDIAASIWERSQGNAFFAEELLAARSPAGALPDTLRDVLVARLASLSDATQAVVRVAAAGGTRVSPAMVARVMETPEPALDGALREAVARHVLVAHDGTVDAPFAFRHALVQEAAYAELLPGERSRLHAAFATALAETPGHDASRAMELAVHWQAAQDLPRAFDAWIRAGLAAEGIFASAEARAGFEHALELWDRVADATVRSPLDRVELLMRAAFHAEGPAPGRSIAYIREAIGMVDPTLDPTRAGMLHERLGQYSWNMLDTDTILAAYEEAVRLVPPEPPSRARAWVLAGLARCYSELDRPADARARCSEALAMASALGDRQVEARTLVVLGRSLTQLGDVDAGVATIGRGYDVAAEVADVHEQANALTWLAGALQESGRSTETVAACLDVEAFAIRHGIRGRWGAAALERGAWSLFDLGRWDEAEALLGRALLYELAGINEVMADAQLLLLETLRGQAEAARRRAPRVWALAERHPHPVILSTLTEFALWNDDPAAVRTAVTMVGAPGREIRYIGYLLSPAIRAEADLASVARSRGATSDVAECRARGAAAREQLRRAHAQVTVLLPGGIPVTTALLATCEAELSRLDGASDPDRWASAAVAWESLGKRNARAYALMREGEAALARQRDRPRAARALQDAWEIANGMGAVRLLGVIDGLAQRANIALRSEEADAPEPAVRPGPAPAGRRPRDRYALTRREREVLALVAAGRSDGEIAEELFISKKTASYHVATIKGKLGARSRVGIATDALGLGLLDAPVPPGA